MVRLTETHELVAETIKNMYNIQTYKDIPVKAGDIVKIDQNGDITTPSDSAVTQGYTP